MEGGGKSVSKGTLAKVMKYELRYIDGCGTFEDMQRALWNLQRTTREILNRTIQIAFHWDYINREHFAQTGEYLDVKKETGYNSLPGHIYNSLKVQCEDMATANINATIQKAWSKYTTSKNDVLRGEMSLPSYKSDQPLIINKNCVKLSQNGPECIAELTLFSNKYKKATGTSSNVRFAFRLNDNTQRMIAERVLIGEYGLGQCQLVYRRPKWFFYLTYTFSPIQNTLDPQKILGVDLGESVALYASSIGEYGSLKLEGGEITEFANRVEARKRSMQKQAAYCGEGRKGHGAKTRVSDVYKTEEYISNFRDTINHRYSKALIEYAVKHRYGVIQMEDLTGIKSSTDFPKFLRHWTYYDLQTKIKAKAKEHGIEIVLVDPRYTSQRCSKCGHINKDNRKSQSQFICIKCGFKANADFNASQNLSIKGIADIIKKELSANTDQS